MILLRVLNLILLGLVACLAGAMAGLILFAPFVGGAWLLTLARDRRIRSRFAGTQPDNSTRARARDRMPPARRPGGAVGTSTGRRSSGLCRSGSV